MTYSEYLAERARLLAHLRRLGMVAPNAVYGQLSPRATDGRTRYAQQTAQMSHMVRWIEDRGRQR